MIWPALFALFYLLHSPYLFPIPYCVPFSLSTRSVFAIWYDKVSLILILLCIKLWSCNAGWDLFPRAGLSTERTWVRACVRGDEMEWGSNRQDGSSRGVQRGFERMKAASKGWKRLTEGYPPSQGHGVVEGCRQFNSVMLRRRLKFAVQYRHRWPLLVTACVSALWLAVSLVSQVYGLNGWPVCVAERQRNLNEARSLHCGSCLIC